MLLAKPATVRQEAVVANDQVVDEDEDDGDVIDDVINDDIDDAADFDDVVVDDVVDDDAAVVSDADLDAQVDRLAAEMLDDDLMADVVDGADATASPAADAANAPAAATPATLAPTSDVDGRRKEKLSVRAKVSVRDNGESRPTDKSFQIFFLSSLFSFPACARPQRAAE